MKRFIEFFIESIESMIKQANKKQRNTQGPDWAGSI